MKGRLSGDQLGQALQLFDGVVIMSVTANTSVNIDDYMAFRTSTSVGYKYGDSTIFMPILKGAISGCVNKTTIMFDADCIIELM